MFRNGKLAALCMLILAPCCHAATKDVLTFSCTGQLSFGAIAANSGGTVTVAPKDSPPRASTGTVIQAKASAISSPKCSVGVTKPNPQRTLTFSVSLPPDGAVKLNGPGAASMAVNHIVATTNDQNAIGQNPMAGSFTSTASGVFHVGATLVVGANQTPGSYSGSISVTMDWP